MSLQNADDLLPVGAVIGIHGLRGDLKVRPDSGEATVLDTVETITLQQPGGMAKSYIVQKVSRHKGNLLFRLDGITSAESAELLIGSNVLILRKELGQLPEDEFYWFELEGLQVIDRQQGEIGSIHDIFTTPAHDILVVQGSRGEVLIPLVDSLIIEIDAVSKVMHVDLPEGLVPELPQTDAL